MKKKYIPVDERNKVIDRDGTNCFYCGKGGVSVPGCKHRVIEKEPEEYLGTSIQYLVMHYDHIIPESKGGITCADNLVLACRKCNLTKGDKI